MSNPHPLGYDLYHAFKAVADEPSCAHEEDSSYGAVNSLLNAHFPLQSGFMVVPRPVPIGCHDEEFVFTVEFDVRYKGKTVLVVLAKPGPSLRSPSVRKDADKRMRARFSDLYEACPVDRLHGIIFFGVRFAYYGIDRETGVWAPPRPMRRTDSRVDLEPNEGLWHEDILVDEDAEGILELFGTILRACRAEDW
jgi:hypothetical protein